VAATLAAFATLGGSLLAGGCGWAETREKRFAEITREQAEAKAVEAKAAKKAAIEAKRSRRFETLPDVEDRLAKFVPVDLDFDESILSETDRKVLVKLSEVAKLMDEAFSRQVDSESALRWASLRRAAAAGEVPREAFDFFEVMFGMWDRTDSDRPFVLFPGDVGWRQKPPGAGFYPADLTKEEFDAYVRDNPGEEARLRSMYTIVRRSPTGRLEAVPYSAAFKDILVPAAKLLEEAAELTDNESLKRFLQLRAQAFRTDDYMESEIAWMELEGVVVEPTIGPYEVYEDRLLGAKAAFEAFITIRDSNESAALEKLAARLPELEQALPLDEKHRAEERGTASPISVAIEVVVGGDTLAGVQTAAFNLPNDERVREAKGTKKVMLKNVIQAKFDAVLAPIAERIVAEGQLGMVAFEPFFTEILMHELSHGLGPGWVTRPGGKRVQVSEALETDYSAIEEAKADLVGLYCLEQLVGLGDYDAEFLEMAYVAYLAGCFRAVRFGATEAHGKAAAIAFNGLRDRNAIVLDDEAGRYSVDVERMPGAVKELAARLLEIEANGDREAAKEWLEKDGAVRSEMKAVLLRLSDLPIDIRPRFTVFEKAKGW
jgi:hypothetical protein